jgi:hypothetical protein
LSAEKEPLAGASDGAERIASQSAVAIVMTVRAASSWPSIASAWSIVADVGLSSPIR